MSKGKVFNVSTEDGDWEGFYVDGKLIDEGHSVNPAFLLEKMGYEVDSIELTEDQIEDLGYSLPPTMEKIDEVRP